MREAGCVFTCVSLIVALGFSWLGYVMTFESDGLLAGMENTPKEGWDYWMRKEFWRDFWSFAIYLTFSVMGVLLPLIATARSRRPILERRTADWALFFVSLIHTRWTTRTTRLNERNTINQGRTKRMQATARMASVVSSTLPARRRLIRSVRPTQPIVMIELECIFCQIISGERHSIMVAQSQFSGAFMDIQPVNLGHVLIVPRRHVTSFTELTPPEVADLMITAQEVARGLRTVCPDHDGITLSLADGLSAGQDVPHTHLHVIPRKHTDGFGWRRLGRSSDRETLERLGQEIRTTIGSAS